MSHFDENESRIVNGAQPAGIGHNLPPSDAEIMAQTLSEKHKAKLDEGRKLFQKAADLPATVTTDDQESAITDFIVDMRKWAKELDGLRETEKRPHLDANTNIEAFFKKPLTAVDMLKGKLDVRVLAWKKVKRDAEAARLAKVAAQERENAANQRAAAQSLEAAGDARATVVAKQADRVEAKAEAIEAKVTSGRGLGASKSAAGTSSGIKKTWVGERIPDAALDLLQLAPYLKPEAVQVAINAAVAAGVRELTGVKIYEKESLSVRS